MVKVTPKQLRERQILAEVKEKMIAESRRERKEKVQNVLNKTSKNLKSASSKLLRAVVSKPQASSTNQEKNYNKYRYVRDENGRIIKKYGLSGWSSAREKKKTESLFSSIKGTLQKSVDRLSEEEPRPRPKQSLDKRRFQLQKQLQAQRQYISMNNATRNPNNKFEERLREQASYNLRLREARAYSEQPQDFLRRKLLEKQKAVMEAREFSRRNNILHAHKAQLTEKENSIDFLDERDSILKAENLFSQNNPNRININKTNRPSILQTREGGNNLQF